MSMSLSSVFLGETNGVEIEEIDVMDGDLRGVGFVFSGMGWYAVFGVCKFGLTDLGGMSSMEDREEIEDIDGGLLV